MLLFKKKFLDLIARGEKRQTVRVWPKRRLRPGQREFIPGLGRVRIDAFDRVRPADLTETDARLDGFASREALLDELRALYGDRLDDVPCFRIVFTYPFESDARSRTPNGTSKTTSAGPPSGDDASGKARAGEGGSA